MQNTSRALLIATLLVGVATAVQAAPKDDDRHQGKGHGKDKGHSAQSGQDSPVRQAAPVVQAAQQSWRSPVRDTSSVRQLIVRHPEYHQPAAALPPGIARNVGRGKPLPPGIARKIDPRMERELPRYEGYEWRQVGTDVVLVAITTGIVVEILDHLFD